MRTCRRQNVQGFTILEIMVALALLGLVIAAVYSSWMAIVHGAETGMKATAEIQRARVAVRTLEEALTSARSFASDIQYYSFVAENGEEATISFVARLSKSFPRSGRFGELDVRRLTFSVEPGPDSHRQLVLRQNPIMMDWDIDEKEHPIVLAKDVKEFKILFWDAHLNPPDWVDEWTQTNQLPPLIMFTLVLGSDPLHPNQGREEIPRIVALPAVTVQPAWQAPGLQSALRTGSRPPGPSALQPGK